MRFLSIAAALLCLGIASPSYAQAWDEFTSREDHFTVNFPGEPAVEAIQYKTAKGTNLKGNIYTAKDARGGIYKITVVDYNGAQGEEGTAIDEWAAKQRTTGTVKYDGVEHQNNMRSQRISVQLANGRFSLDRKSTRLNSSHVSESRMPSSA